MQCELCGKKIETPRYVIIDGVRMLVCEECAKYGTPAPPPPSKDRIKRLVLKKRTTADEKIFQSMKKVLVENWAERIRDARMKKGLSREELGSRIGEPTVAIAKMENGDLRPSDETAKKLEKVLNITLFQEVEDVHIPTSSSKGGLTLGDLIKLEKENHEERRD